MNVQRFTARTSREAMVLVREALGTDAVLLSTKPCAEGVEILAMAPGAIQKIERMTPPAARPSTSSPPVAHPSASSPQTARPAAPSPARQAAPSLAARAAAALPSVAGRARPAAAPTEVEGDVEKLAMSTLSFQDYVRERMLRRRDAEMNNPAAEAAPAEPEFAPPPPPARQPAPRMPASESHPLLFTDDDSVAPSLQARLAASAPAARPLLPTRSPPVLHDEIRHAAPAPVQHAPVLADPQAEAARARRDQEVFDELRSMKGLIEERFGALAFMEKLQRNPAQARLTQKLLDCGFSPALIRKLSESLGADIVDESAWAASVLERNLLTGENEPALEDLGGVYAMIGSTGVGKTTSTAKLAAAFATRYGASNLGLVTLDAYRVGAHEQLRAYGRILGVPVHTAHDRASLEDLLELLAGKKMVIIDTAGMAQRDTRTRELLDMLGHRSIQKLLVVNASAQGETIEDVLISYRASLARGVILSKMDEAVKLAPALDALIRHKLTVLGVANGQRVPEDWHRLSSHALVHRALRPTAGQAYRMDASDVNLVFAAPPVSHAARGAQHA